MVEGQWIVSSNIEGTLTWLLDLGDKVETGETFANIEDFEYEAHQLESTRAGYIHHQL